MGIILTAIMNILADNDGGAIYMLKFNSFFALTINTLDFNNNLANQGNL